MSIDDEKKQSRSSVRICSHVNSERRNSLKKMFGVAVACKKKMSNEDFVYQEAHYKVLRLLERNPDMNQREISIAAGVSLGKTNYCINALLEKGLIKVKNFQKNKSKLAYSYLLTPAGVAEKAFLTRRFLKLKMEEYELIRKEIEILKKDIKNN